MSEVDATRFPLTAVAALLLLTGCEQGGSAPPVAASPAAVSTAFDGSYRGTLRLTRDALGRCGAPVIERVLVITAGRGVLVYNRDQNLSASGPVDAAGRFTLAGDAEATVRIEGQIRDGRATGRFESRNCSYTVELVRAA